MGLSRRVRRGRRAVLVAGLVTAAVGGAAACEPGGLNTATVAFTTDQTVTRELNRQKADVRWLTCTASYDGDGASASADEKTVAEVNCEGQTDDGKDITVDGEVTRVVEGACVRGRITAKVDGKEWFRVEGLGNCDATPTPTPPVRHDPTGDGPRPTVTVTVTRTVYCQERPDCWPEGK
ncbi:hypothetical protein [Streptomyces sp. NPDC005876]|uniref:hypothetical protein n=1 Tax=unclassified Streptomyces TaxID=2593676 RepID=UPI0033D06E93